jgi:DNA mismatch repair protein MutS2
MHAYRVLEFPAIRERLAAHCETEIGARLARELEPWWHPEAVRDAIALTGEACDLLDAGLAPSLGLARDLRQAARRAAKGGALDGGSLYQIGEALGAMRAARAALLPRRERAPRLAFFAEALFERRELETRLADSLEGSGELRDSASPELARLRKLKVQTSQRLLERIQAYTSGPRRDLLSDPIVTQREGRYVIPLKAENRGKVKGVVHDTSATGQTIYVEPEDVLQIGNALREAEAAERAESARILAALSQAVGVHGEAIAAGLAAAGELDLVLAKARYGYAEKGCLPVLAPGRKLAIKNGRHPLLDPAIAVPLTLELGEKEDGLLITGPNTGGKTVAIKTVGLAVLMAQAGLMPPAAEVRIGPFSQVWADIGDEQSLQQSLSTFSGHIKNIAEALAGIEEGGLVLLDEIGAGTDPAEGAALAKALLLELQRRGARIMASTHYGELKVFAYNAPGFVNAAMEFDVKSLRPTYRLVMGAPGASHALRIAERYGIPKHVVEQARRDPGVDREDVARMLERLEQAQKQAQRAQSEADRLAARLRQVEAEAESRLKEAEEARRTARQKAAETLDAALREIRLEAKRIFDDLKADPSPKGVERARERLKDLQDVGADFARAMRPAAPTPQTPDALAKGDQVRVRGYTQIGTVIDTPRQGKVAIQVGPLKMTVPLNQVERVDSAQPNPPAVVRAARTNIGLGKALAGAPMELHLRHLRAEEAEHVLQRFIDDAILAGYHRVRIVHGKGGGVLRKITHATLRKHPQVEEFFLADAHEGGEGVTIVVF